MTLFEKLDRQRHEAMIAGFFDMWGVVMHPETYHELTAECIAMLDKSSAFLLTANETYIFGLRLIPSFGVPSGTFTIVDERLGKTILGKEKELCMR